MIIKQSSSHPLEGFSQELFSKLLLIIDAILCVLPKDLTRSPRASLFFGHHCLCATSHPSGSRRRQLERGRRH